MYIGGDGGYDTHFAKIGKKFGPFDLAIVEQGQYDEKWKYTHLLPNEVLKVAQDLKAKRLFPGHNSKFALATHPWDEPLTKITENNKDVGTNKMGLRKILRTVLKEKLDRLKFIFT